MNISRPLRILLVIAGLVGVYIGGSLLLDPVGFEASAGVDLPRDASLLSEIRAPGGALLIHGVLILLGAFVAELTFTSTLVATLFLLSYGLSRALGIVLDGMPSDPIFLAMLLELALGGACLVALVSARPRRAQR